MQPNDQQGYNQPGQPTPPQPAVSQSLPMQPAQVVQPVQPIQPLSPVSAAPTIDPVALQAALDEPASGSVATAPSVTPATAPVVPVISTPSPLEEEAEAGVVDVDDGNEEYEEEADVTWVASEYIHQEKGTLWFTLFAVILLALGGVSIFLMKSWSFAVLLVVIAIVVVVYSRRPPRQLEYALTEDGLIIDKQLHKFSLFKSFGVIRDGEEFSVMLIPIQRFQPGITVYFPEESGEAIVDALGARLPMKDLHLDVIDRVVRLLRL